MKVSCVALNERRPCQLSPVMVTPVPLCETHRLQVAISALPELIWRAIAPDGSERAKPQAEDPDAELLVDQAWPVRFDAPVRGRHEAIVYFTANGGRVKIGFTRNLRERLNALCVRREAVLLLLRGGRELEAALHQRFAACRVTGTEWFDLAPDLLSYIGTRLARPASPVQPAIEPATIPAQNAPVYAPPDMDEARTALLDVLSDLRASGAGLVGPRHIWSERKGSVNRSRAWVSAQMSNLADQGVLLRTSEPGLYAFAAPSEGEAS